jgi:plastocyanin
MSMFCVRYVALVSVLAVMVACSPAPARPTSTPKPPKPAAKLASPVASASPSAEGQQIRLGDFSYADYGLRDVRGKSSQDVDVGDFYFKGTFLRGTSGQKLRLRIQNVARVPHNVSLPSQQVDRDIPPGRQRVEVDVTVPESGALRFFCKYHAAQGMNAQLLVDDAEPQPVAHLSQRSTVY